MFTAIKTVLTAALILTFLAFFAYWAILPSPVIYQDTATRAFVGCKNRHTEWKPVPMDSTVCKAIQEKGHYEIVWVAPNWTPSSW